MSWAFLFNCKWMLKVTAAQCCSKNYIRTYTEARKLELAQTKWKGWMSWPSSLWSTGFIRLIMFLAFWWWASVNNAREWRKWNLFMRSFSITISFVSVTSRVGMGSLGVTKSSSGRMVLSPVKNCALLSPSYFLFVLWLPENYKVILSHSDY